MHPIIRRYRYNTLIAEHHVIEDLASEWLEEVHFKPLIEFLQNNLFTWNDSMSYNSAESLFATTCS